MGRKDLNYGNARYIYEEGRRLGMNNAQIAYALATTEHETARTFKGIGEFDGKNQAIRNKYQGNGYLGNYYYGRGYIQLTHLPAYQKAQKDIVQGVYGYKDVDIVKNPDWLVSDDPRAARVNAYILLTGLRDGRYSGDGSKLENWVSTDGKKKDYYNARRLVNMGDKKTYQPVAQYAADWEQELSRQDVLRRKYMVEAKPASAATSNSQNPVYRRNIPSDRITQ